MIITTTRHGRSARDTRNLTRHLAKQDGQLSRVVSIGNVPFSNSDDALTYMNMMRDGSRADVAFHHLTLSPSARITDDQRDEAVQRILSALDAPDHPYVVWEHSEKARQGGDVDQHFHIVLGHIGPDGKALDDSHSFAKLEAVARSLEVDFEHALTPSRRTAAVASRLVEMGREDVAQHLQIPDELPRSSMTSSKRAMAARNGVDLAEVQQVVRDAWSRSASISEFKASVLNGGVSVTPGTKDGVWIVRHRDIEVGALDRIVKEKRRDVAQKMKGFENGDRASEITISDEKTRGSNLSRDAEAPTVVEPIGSSRAIRERADRADQGLARNASAGTETASPVDRGSSQQGRRFDEIKAIKDLSAIRISTSVIQAAQDIRMRSSSMEVSRFQHRQAVEQIYISAGWERLQKLKDRLLEAIKMTADRVRAFRTPPEPAKPTYSLRDQQIADVFRKAALCSAENIERLEKLDPDLDRFRLHHGGEAFQSMSTEQILERLEYWREQARYLNELDHEYRGPRFA